MIYKIIGKLDDNLIEHIPQELIDCWRTGLCLIAVAEEEDDLIGVTAFMMPYGSGKNVILSYVYVAEAYRRQGIATALVLKTIDMLAVKGFKTVRAIMSCNNMDETVILFLKSLQFDDKNETANYVSFVLGKIKESELYKKLVCEEALISRVKSFQEVTSTQIEEFKLQLWKQQNVTVIGDFDQDMACFYMQDERIVAISDYLQTSIFEISRSNIYALQELDAQIAFPSMLVYFINRALETKSEDTIIRMFVYEKSEYRGLTLTVGEDITIEPVVVYEREA